MTDVERAVDRFWTVLALGLVEATRQDAPGSTRRGVPGLRLVRVPYEPVERVPPRDGPGQEDR